MVVQGRQQRDPLTRLVEFTLSPFAALRAVRCGRANGLATLSPKGARGLSKIERDKILVIRY
jgi:hypothetical protein